MTLEVGGVFFFLMGVLFTHKIPNEIIRRLLLFSGVLFTQEIPNEIILLCMDYGVAVTLKKIESQK